VHSGTEEAVDVHGVFLFGQYSDEYYFDQNASCTEEETVLS
jgi:hypothetical protein